MGSLMGKAGAVGASVSLLEGPLMFLGTGELLFGILVEPVTDWRSLIEVADDNCLADDVVDVRSQVEDRSDDLVEIGRFILKGDAGRQRKLEGAARWNVEGIDVCRS